MYPKNKLIMISKVFIKYLASLPFCHSTWNIIKVSFMFMNGNIDIENKQGYKNRACAFSTQEKTYANFPFLKHPLCSYLCLAC